MNNDNLQNNSSTEVDPAKNITDKINRANSEDNKPKVEKAKSDFVYSKLSLDENRKNGKISVEDYCKELSRLTSIYLTTLRDIVEKKSIDTQIKYSTLNSKFESAETKRLDNISKASLDSLKSQEYNLDFIQKELNELSEVQLNNLDEQFEQKPERATSSKYVDKRLEKKLKVINPLVKNPSKKGLFSKFKGLLSKITSLLNVNKFEQALAIGAVVASLVIKNMAGIKNVISDIKTAFQTIPEQFDLIKSVVQKNLDGQGDAFVKQLKVLWNSLNVNLGTERVKVRYEVFMGKNTDGKPLPVVIKYRIFDDGHIEVEELSSLPGVKEVQNRNKRGKVTSTKYEWTYPDWIKKNPGSVFISSSEYGKSWLLNKDWKAGGNVYNLSVNDEKYLPEQLRSENWSKHVARVEEYDNNIRKDKEAIKDKRQANRSGYLETNDKDLDKEFPKKNFDSIVKAMEFFMSKGLTKDQAAGLVANLYAESKLKINADSKGGIANSVSEAKGAYGIAQWLGKRKTKLKELYGEHPTLEQQLEFVWSELNDTHKTGLSKLKGSKTTTEAARNGLGYYEFQAGLEVAKKKLDESYKKEGVGEKTEIDRINFADYIKRNLGKMKEVTGVTTNTPTTNAVKVTQPKNVGNEEFKEVDNMVYSTNQATDSAVESIIESNNSRQEKLTARSEPKVINVQSQGDVKSASEKTIVLNPIDPRNV